MRSYLLSNSQALHLSCVQRWTDLVRGGSWWIQDFQRIDIADNLTSRFCDMHREKAKQFKDVGKERHPVPFLLFFYKVYKRPLTPPPFPRFIVTMQIYENTFTTFFLLNMIP